MKYNYVVKTFLSLALLFLVFCESYSQSISPDVKKALDKRFEKLIKKNKVVGASVALIENGEIIYSTGFGFSDLSSQKRANSKSFYRIGSISKSFTAVAILKLQEQGLLDINESIKKYIPELTMQSIYDDNNELIIKDILSHISGLPSDLMNGMMSQSPPSSNWTIEQLNHFVTSSPRNYNMAYSNVGYGLLGELISRVSGMSYAEYVQKNIFEPLNMDRSSCSLDHPELVKAYIDKEEYSPEQIRDYAAGSIVSSVDEMANYIKMLLNKGNYNQGAFLSSESIESFETNQVGHTIIPSEEDYGFAIQISNLDVSGDPNIQKASLYNHGGDTYAFHSNFGYIPELNIGAVILTNSENGGRIRSISQFLNFYLEKSKDITIEINHPNLEDTDGNEMISDEELLGHYNLGPFAINVENSKKITFKQGKQTVLLKRKDNTNKYSVTIKLLGFIPMKIKAVELEFVKISGEIFIKQNHIKRKNQQYISKKDNPVEDIGKWAEKLGKYELINAIPSSAKEFSYEDATIDLLFEGGLLILDIQSSSNPQKLIFNVINETIAKTGGVGRHAGNNLVILPNGNLAFWGYELKKST